MEFGMDMYKLLYLKWITNKDPLYSMVPWWLSGKESACQWRRHVFNPWVRKIPWRKKWQPTLISLPGKFHGQRILASYSPWCCKESDTTLIPGLGQSPGGGNDNPHTLLHSCLGNSMDRGSWWAIAPGVAKSWTWLNNWAVRHICDPSSTEQSGFLWQPQDTRHWQVGQLRPCQK